MFEQPVFGELGVVSVDRDGKTTDFRDLGMERFQLVFGQDITALLWMHSRMVQNLVYRVSYGLSDLSDYTLSQLCVQERTCDPVPNASAERLV